MSLYDELSKLSHVAIRSHQEYALAAFDFDIQTQLSDQPRPLVPLYWLADQRSDSRDL